MEVAAPLNIPPADPTPEVPAVESAPSETVADAAPPASVEAASEGSDSTVEEPAKVEGEPEAEGEKPAEEEAEKPAEEPTAKESAILRSLRKKEAKLVERERQHAQRRDELDAYIAKINPQIERFNQERSLASQDPLRYLAEVHGYSLEDIGRRIINGGKPSEQEQTTRERKAYDERIAALEAQLKAQKEASEKEATTKAAAEQRATVEREFVKLATDNAAKLPLLTKRFAGDHAALVETGHAVADKLRATLKREPAWTEILAFVEKDLRATAQLLAPTSATGAVTTESAAQTAPKGTEKQGQKGQEAKGTTAPTLTGKGAAQRASMPKDPLLLSPEEERELVLAEIDKAKKGRAA